jgi:hypothetical protein
MVAASAQDDGLGETQSGVLKAEEDQMGLEEGGNGISIEIVGHLVWRLSSSCWMVMARRRGRRITGMAGGEGKGWREARRVK